MLNFIICVTLAVSMPCWGAHASSPGEVYPEKVEAPIGANVNITCTMDPKSFPDQDSSDLLFIDANTNEKVPQDFIHVVNATSIVFVMKNATEHKTVYRCICGPYAIMESKVYIGTPPRDVSSLECRSYDFEYMTCNFTQPQNSIYTKYTLTFNTGSNNMHYNFSCNFDSIPLVVCNDTIAAHNWLGNYNFKLVAKNALGNNTKYFPMNISDILIPEKPGKDFHVSQTTTDAFEANWKISHGIYYNNRGLQWEVVVQPENMAPLNFSSSAIKRKNSRVHLHLNSLPYAFYWYELRLRSKLLNSTATLWSDPFVYRFRTVGKKPSRPPRTDVGSFFYVGSQETEVRLYWEQLEEYEYNGQNFEYVVSNIQKDGNSIQLAPKQLEMNFAEFEFQTKSHYKFEIRSRNHIGESQSASYIEIFPLTSENHKNCTPRSIRNVYSDRTYTLTWESPVERTELIDYTVYWCYTKRNKCISSLHFKHLDKQTHKFTTEPQSAEHELNLAVSANYIKFNTGMHWPPCTGEVNSDLAKMIPELYEVSATTITVQFSSENICLSVLEGYNLTYCQMLNKQIVKCWNKSIEKNVNKFEISALRPYTQYKIVMNMYSKKKVGKVSEPLFVSTSESAPSPPRELKVLQVRNTSADISWSSPSQPNGIIRSYLVKYNNEIKIVPANETNITLTGLVSHTRYKVFASANTIYSSNYSNDIVFDTLIGYPSVPRTENVNDTDNGTIIQWKKPSEPAGNIDYYEVAVTEMRNGMVMRRRISIVAGNTSCALKPPRCIDHDYKTSVAVRAVNVAEFPCEDSTNDIDDNSSHWDPDSMYYDDNDEFICAGGTMLVSNVTEYRNTSSYCLYKSGWQDQYSFNCSSRRISEMTLLSLMVVLSAIAVMSAFYMGHKKYYKMANIHCTLPPGLDINFTKDGIDGNNTPTQTCEEEERTPGVKNIWHNNNEKHHLLDSSGSDYGPFSTEYSASAASTICDNATTNKEVNSKSSADCMKNADVGENLNGNENKTNYATMKPNGSIAAPYSLLAKMNNNGGNYIKPLQNDWQVQKDQQQKIEMNALPLTTFKPSDGYILESALQKSSIEGMANNTTGGYVKPNALQNLTTTTSVPMSTQSHETVPKANIGDYTTLEQLGRIAPPLSDLPQTNASGYTTLQQLGQKVAIPASTFPQANTNGYSTLEQLQKMASPPSTTLPQTNSNGYTTLDQLTKNCSPASSTLPQSLERNILPSHSVLPQTNANGYTTLEQLGKNVSQPQINSSGYTTLEQMGKNASQTPSTLPQANSNGYTTFQQMSKSGSQAASALPPTTNLNGYTTLGELGLIVNPGHDEPRTTSLSANGAGISGYVTQRELTAFGQKRN